MNKFDIFISYRREGGFSTAKHLYDLLKRDGYAVSFDIDTLRNGDFDSSLLNRIDECKDFLLIVAPNTFDRTLDPNYQNEDWVRWELAHALKKGKNIIPIFLNGLNGFPENLPRDIAKVSKKNGLTHNNEYFDEFYDRLKARFLLSQPIKRIRIPSRSIALSLISIVIIALAIFGIFNFDNLFRRASPSEMMTEAEKELELGNLHNAFLILEKLAMDGNEEAQDYLGYFYKEGIAVDQDYKKSAYWYQLAADKGFANSQAALGQLYLEGQGVEQSYFKALNYFELAAEQLDLDAIFYLGKMYYEGLGVDQNYSKAFKYLKISADEGDMDSQLVLAEMYENGLGIKPSNFFAKMYYKLASAQGCDAAAEALKRLE